jgi:hypothetical protein
MSLCVGAFLFLCLPICPSVHPHDVFPLALPIFPSSSLLRRYHHHRHHHHHRLANMQYSHLLTRADLTPLKLSLMVSHSFFRLLVFF